MIFQKLTSDRSLATVSYFVTALLGVAAAVAIPRLLEQKNASPPVPSATATVPISYPD